MANPQPKFSSHIPYAPDPQRRINRLRQLLSDDHWQFQKANLTRLIQLYENGELAGSAKGVTTWLYNGEVVKSQPTIDDMKR
ncbi:60S ribosomal protein L43, partial [Ophidiomyces ophidiicola]